MRETKSPGKVETEETREERKEKKLTLAVAMLCLRRLSMAEMPIWAGID